MSLIEPDRYIDLMNSKEFMTLYNNISNNNVRFRDLPDKEKRIALAILMNNDVDVINGLNETLFVRPMPSIKEFLSSSDWIGPLSSQIYPYWRSELEILFDPLNSYSEGVFGGAIGIGKSSIARLGILYNQVKVCCLREPQMTLNQTPETILATQLMTIDLNKGWLTLGRPIYDIMKRSSMFIEVPKKEKIQAFNDLRESRQIPFCDMKGMIEFPNNLVITIGSTPSHALGMTLVGALLDEAEFRLSGPSSSLDLYTQLKERVRSRMLDQRTSLMPKYTFLALVSSAKNVNGVLHEYTKSITDDDPFTRVLGKPIWEVRDVDPYTKGYFYVMRGTQTHPSRILDLEHSEVDTGTFNPPTNCEVIKVPTIYRSDFNHRIEKALQNLAGVNTISDDMPFDNVDSIDTDSLVETPEFNLTSDYHNGSLPLIQKIPLSLWTNDIGGLRLKRYPLALRYIHLDMAETAEAGLTMLHKEVGRQGETIYVIDFCTWITSPTRIDFKQVKSLLHDLRYKANINIHTISTDQFQSSYLRQELESENCAEKVIYRSVDRSSASYELASSMVSSGVVKYGKCPKLKSQLSSIFISNGKPFSRDRKDMADSFVGALSNSIDNFKDQPMYPYEGISKESLSMILQDYEEC